MYTGKLGARIDRFNARVQISVWSPVAQNVRLLLYGQSRHDIPEIKGIRINIIINCRAQVLLNMQRFHAQILFFLVLVFTFLPYILKTTRGKKRYA